MNKQIRQNHHPRAAAWLRGLVIAAASLVSTQGAWAQFAMVPAPVCPPPAATAAEDEKAFRLDAARHIYACYPMRVFRGRLPPLLYGVMMVETEIDAGGNVVASTVIRKPAADDAAPWVLALIKRAAPYPAPAKMPGGTVKFTETFFIDKSGLFQLFTLTEGQR